MSLFPRETTPRILAAHVSKRIQIDVVGEGIVIGIIAGTLISAYRVALHTSEEFILHLSYLLNNHPLLVPLWLVIAGAIGWFVWTLMHIEPDTKGSGIPQVVAETQGFMSACWWKVIPLKFCEGVGCALAGLSMGREGPSVQLGGMCGSMVARITHRHTSHKRLLVTCGAAAGMSAAFHAPLTGCLFALEEIHSSFNSTLLVAAMISSICADFVSSTLLGVAPALRFEIVRDLHHNFYWFLIPFATVCGIVGAYHNKWMFYLKDQVFAKLYERFPKLPFILVFLISTIAIYFLPIVCCGGDGIFGYIDNKFHPLDASYLLFLFVVKFLCTSICFSSSAPGGTLFPLCSLGALLGAVCAVCGSSFLNIPDIYITNFVVCGIAGMFASVIRAPVCAAVLAFELTGTLNQLLVVSIVSIIAYLVSNIFEQDGFFEHLTHSLIQSIRVKRACARQNERTQLQKTPKSALRGHMIVETLHISAESPLIGKRIADISWPSGSRIMMIKRAGENILPVGSSELFAHDELLCAWLKGREDSIRDAMHKLTDVQFK